MGRNRGRPAYFASVCWTVLNRTFIIWTGQECRVRSPVLAAWDGPYVPATTGATLGEPLLYHLRTLELGTTCKYRPLKEPTDGKICKALLYTNSSSTNPANAHLQ